MGLGQAQASRQRFAALLRAASVHREERQLAGVIGGMLLAMGGLTLPLLVVLPGASQARPWAVLAVAATAGALGLLSMLVLDWQQAPWWGIHALHVTGVVLGALAIAATGGARSSAWIYLFSVVVFAAYFYGRSLAYVYAVAAVAVHALPILYDSRALHGASLTQLAIAAPAYLTICGAISAGKRRIWSLHHLSERLAEQQSALRRVATAVVSGLPADGVYEQVAQEAAALLGAGAAGILRLEDETTALVVGSWADHPGGRYLPGTHVPVRAGGEVEQALLTGRPATVSAHGPGTPVVELGYASSIVAPVRVAGRIWGVLAVCGSRPSQFGAEDEERLIEFGDLLSTAITGLEDRGKLAARAYSDPLTGLANHRVLQQRLAAEAARARRRSGALAVAVLDVDSFKHINDSAGHEAGDQVLAQVAGCLMGLARTEDTLGRVGGDEFAWILPDTTAGQALVAVERARLNIAETLTATYGVTISAGICDTAVTDDPGQLVNLADGALYWSKAHGRNQTWIYDPATVEELSAQERAERLERSRALIGLRALARAIDAKDHATRRHSERVADLCVRLADAVGWPPERTKLLAEAALVHDVGKIGVPDRLLRKAGPLTAAEQRQMRSHAELAARMVEDILTPEQVDWIRTHHERPDGSGYPRGLQGAEIPEGAGLLALADAWDAMTVGRSYNAPKPIAPALEECKALIGRQFTKTAVMALMALPAAEQLEGPEATAAQPVS